MPRWFCDVGGAICASITRPGLVEDVAVIEDARRGAQGDRLTGSRPQSRSATAATAARVTLIADRLRGA